MRNLAFELQSVLEANRLVAVMIPFQVPLPPGLLDPGVFFTNLLWTLTRSFVTFVICFGIGLAGLRILDWLTPGIKELRKIKHESLPTALFALGMFVFLSLAFLGSVTAPLPIGVSSGLGAAVSPWLIFTYRLIALLGGFLISLLFAAVFYRILGVMAPFGIDLDDVNKSSLATAVYVMGYMVFLGVIVYGSLLLPV